MTVKISQDESKAFEQDQTAINFSGTIWRHIVKNAVNSGKLLQRTILSQAQRAISGKVQRLAISPYGAII